MCATEIRRCASGVLVNEGRLLLGLRGPTARSHHGQWDVIGGHRELGETDEQTLIRELNEELGVVPINYQRVGVLEEKFLEVPYLISIFAVWKWDGSPTNCSQEHVEIAWYMPSEIPELDLTSHQLIPILSKIALE